MDRRPPLMPVKKPAPATKEGSSPTGSAGPWRDGRFVVVSRDSPMPCCCMVCGAEISQLTTARLRTPVSAWTDIDYLFKKATSDRFLLRHGRCEEHMVPWPRLLGRLSVTATIVLMVLGIPAAMIAADRPGPLLYTTVALIIGSFSVAVITSFFNLSIVKSNGRLMWLTGFGKGFREKLPDLP